MPVLPLLLKHFETLCRDPSYSKVLYSVRPQPVYTSCLKKPRGCILSLPVIPRYQCRGFITDFFKISSEHSASWEVRNTLDIVQLYPLSLTSISSSCLEKKKKHVKNHPNLSKKFKITTSQGTKSHNTRVIKQSRCISNWQVMVLARYSKCELTNYIPKLTFSSEN